MIDPVTGLEVVPVSPVVSTVAPAQTPVYNAAGQLVSSGPLQVQIVKADENDPNQPKAGHARVHQFGSLAEVASEAKAIQDGKDAHNMRFQRFGQTSAQQSKTAADKLALDKAFLIKDLNAANLADYQTKLATYNADLALPVSSSMPATIKTGSFTGPDRRVANLPYAGPNLRKA